jgi:hypothetical protein
VTVALGLVEDDTNFMAVVCAGIRTDTADVIGLLTNKGTQAAGSDDVVRKAKERGAVVVLPHPCRGHILTRYGDY